MIKHIEIDIIPFSEMRYESAGDYFFDENGTLHFKIADMGDDYENGLILVHEMIEEMLTRRKGIKEEDIMAFDLMFEKERSEGLHTDDEEPGWDKRCIYRNEHSFAESIERLCSIMLGVDWINYDKKVMNLGNE